VRENLDCASRDAAALVDLAPDDDLASLDRLRRLGILPSDDVSDPTTMWRIPAAANLADRRAKKSPAPWSVMARSVSDLATPWLRDRRRKEDGEEQDRLLLACIRDASTGCLPVQSLACPRKASQQVVPGPWARGAGRPPSAQHGWTALCRWHARQQYTKAPTPLLLPPGCHE
jgi:hypothetical protein